MAREMNPQPSFAGFSSSGSRFGTESLGEIQAMPSWRYTSAHAHSFLPKNPQGVWGGNRLLVGFAGFGLAQRGRKYVPPPPTANIKVTVLRSTDGKPVNDASVIFHPIKNGKDEGAMSSRATMMA